ncbi:MAG: PilZ domain-containing protein [Hyphomicrobium sp.]
MSVESQVIPSAEPSAGRRTELLLNGDRRRCRRVMMVLQGRFMRADHSEHACTLRDVSVGGASVMTEAPVDLGEHIVAYFENLGGLQGTVARQLEGGFAFQFNVSDHKREKLAAQIMWLINRDAYPDAMGRSHERIGKRGERATLKLEEGVTVDVELLDLSASGASIGTSARPAIGADVSINKIPAVVRRHHEKGFGVQFLTVLPEETLSAVFP